MLADAAPAINLKEILGPVWGPWAAVIVAMFGGASLKWVDNRYTSRGKKTDIEVKLHDEARDEIKDMRAKLDRMDILLRDKDKIHNQMMVKYNLLRGRSGLDLDFDDAEMNRQVQDMMSALELTKETNKKEKDKS